MKKVFEVGDEVTVAAEEEGGIAFNNEHGGTEYFPVGTVKQCKIIKTWGDYEIGRRYIGLTKDKQSIYFGQFFVSVEEAEDNA